MSVDHVRLFFEKVSVQTKLLEQIQHLAKLPDKEYIDKVIKLGRENGYRFDKEDLKQFVVAFLVNLEHTTSMLQKAQEFEAKMKAVNMLSTKSKNGGDPFTQKNKCELVH